MSWVSHSTYILLAVTVKGALLYQSRFHRHHGSASRQVSVPDSTSEGAVLDPSPMPMEVLSSPEAKEIQESAPLSFPEILLAVPPCPSRDSNISVSADKA
eukprot:GILK01033365.1.p1 GENE.GILK01033365.1~~GILK01033365.1.p1  ORF type:complete len:100 (+),score=6.12 GILK01033365.1:103-402(+)